MKPALETLLLAFSAEGGPPIPGRALFLGAEPHEALLHWPEVIGWQPYKPAADAWENAGFTRIDTIPEKTWPLVMLLPGKSRDETLYGFALARARLAPGGVLIAAMPNTAGAARFEKELARATGRITSYQKNKCRAFHAHEDGTWNETLFAEWLALGQPRVIPHTNFTTCPGIFSSEHIDPGSQLLAKHLPKSLRGHVADLGAGWGYLSHAALEHCPGIERIDLFEADSRALACAKRNLACHLPPAKSSNLESEVPQVIRRDLTTDFTDFTDSRLHQEGSKIVPATSSKSVSICVICGSNFLTRQESTVCSACDEPRIRYHWHDVTRGLPETYDAILMNPPFHSGQKSDTGLGTSFLTNAAAALKRGGKLHLVANRQLPYEAVLDSLKLHWRKIAEDATYKVIFAEKR